MRRTVLATALGLLLSLSLGTAASAGSRPGAVETCPGKFEPLTREQLHAQAETYGIPREQADASFDDINVNRDEWICQKGTPFQPGFNWTDNHAARHDR